MNQLPLYELRTRSAGEGQEVWDDLRKKWLVLTPEEHVRQCLMVYLRRELGVPGGLIALERGLKYDRRNKRFDLVVFDRNGQPLLACECKAPYVPLDKNAALQLAVYNRELRAPFLLWTNGPHFISYQLSAAGELHRLEQLPTFEQMLMADI